MFRHDTLCSYCGDNFMSTSPNLRTPICRACQDYICDCDSYQAMKDEGTDEDLDGEIYG